MSAPARPYYLDVTQQYVLRHACRSILACLSGLHPQPQLL